MNLNKHKKLLFQIIKFGIVGVLNTIVDFSIYFTLTKGGGFWKNNYLLANFIAFLSANIISFMLNRKFAFDDKNKENTKVKYIKFISITAVSLIIYQISLFIAVDYVKTYHIYGKIAGVIIGAIWNFLMYKILVFKDIKK